MKKRNYTVVISESVGAIDSRVVSVEVEADNFHDAAVEACAKRNGRVMSVIGDDCSAIRYFDYDSGCFRWSVQPFF